MLIEEFGANIFGASSIVTLPPPTFQYWSRSAAAQIEKIYSEKLQNLQFPMDGLLVPQLP